jgi:hypothetical protein
VTENLPANIDPSDVANMASTALHHTDVAAVLALVIPIVAIVFGISVAMLGMWLDFRKKREMFELHHAERMAAIEKGIDLPPPLRRNGARMTTTTGGALYPSRSAWPT